MDHHTLSGFAQPIRTPGMMPCCIRQLRAIEEPCAPGSVVYCNQCGAKLAVTDDESWRWVAPPRHAAHYKAAS